MGEANDRGKGGTDREVGVEGWLYYLEQKCVGIKRVFILGTAFD